MMDDLLVERGGFEDLNSPSLLMCGDLSPYNVRVDRLVRTELWKEFSKDSCGMYSFLNQYLKFDHDLSEVMDVLATKVHNLPYLKNAAISGGQCLGWLFSMPLAQSVSLPHIAIYQNGKAEVQGKVDDLSNLKVVHVEDLLIEGLSSYREENGEVRGWIPALQGRGAAINDCLCVVSRLQGGEENLALQGISVDSLIKVDDLFFLKHSKQPQECIDYLCNPEEWTRNYLKEEGVSVLVDYFDPVGDRLRYAKNFLNRHFDFLKEMGLDESLNREVNDKYGYSIVKLGV
ncbi:hypothetical protein D6825_00455 [Candidatus Woesearchaeota archaeon]|nr:MAG: hypothetical protein D6825_00455 [Candidatus Woesearchaeota archaeon]